MYRTEAQAKYKYAWIFWGKKEDDTFQSIVRYGSRLAC